MRNVLSKMLYQCADAYQGFNFYPSDELVLILMNVRHYLVEKVLFAKTLLVHLSVNVPRVQPVIQPSNVQEQPSNNVVQMQTVEVVKLASQASACVEEDLILTHPLENVKILMNV